MSLGFLNKEVRKKNNAIVKPTFTNAICYGQTGSGKTAGFILPNIENRLKLNHGLLIYDFKGNLHNQVKSIAMKYEKLKNVFEIGKPWGENIDILKYATDKSLESMFYSISGDKEDTYWTQSSYNLFNNIYKMLKNITLYFKTIRSINEKLYFEIAKDIEVGKLCPSIDNIFNAVKSAKSITRFFEKIKEIKTIVNHSFDFCIEIYYDENKKNIFNLLFIQKNDFEIILESLEEYHVMKDEGESSGKYGVLYNLNSILQSLSTKKAFCKDDYDIVDSLQNGNIVIINVEDFSSQMLNFLNHSIYDRLIRQTSLQKNSSPITIFIDEAQKVINSKSLLDVDVCRENNFEFILATQDLSLLEKQLGSHNSYLLLRNITSQYSFKTVEPLYIEQNTSKLEKFECVDIIEGIKFKVKPIFEKELNFFYSEFLYQAIKKIYKYVEIESDKKYILKYSSQMQLDNKVLIIFEDGTTKEVNLVFDTSKFDKYIQKRVKIKEK